MTVDWIIGRAGVNVMSDMLVAILLDVGKTRPATEPHAGHREIEGHPGSTQDFQLKDAVAL